MKINIQTPGNILLASLSFAALLALALPTHAQVYKSWAAATGFSGVPVTEFHSGLGLVSSARTSATSPMGGTGIAYGYSWTEVGKLHVLAETRTDSLSLAVGSDQNVAFSGRDNTGSFDTSAPGFYATAAQFVVDDLVIPGVGAATISTNMDLHAILDTTAATALGNFTSEGGFYIGFTVSQGGAGIGTGSLKVSRNSAGVTTNTGSGLLPALGAVTPTISTLYTTGNFTVAKGVPVKMDWFLSAYGIAFTNGGNATTAKTDMNSTFSWATSGPVFNIAGGGTASSAQGGISNNLFGGGGASAPEPTSVAFLMLGSTLVLIKNQRQKA
ncbi:hypothetical protein [Armatimonas sp.]|uniref:hypothetical protein n=1 Tax=Armatimonas sp. TaxID=1872638 RepID=UPI00286ACF7F|nr:hypothetical protein [Armatimonas sp.]